MPTYEVRSTTTVYETHHIDAATPKDAFWVLMLDEPAYTKHVERQEVYSIRQVDP